MMTARHLASIAGREMMDWYEKAHFTGSRSIELGGSADFVRGIADGGPAASLSLRACPGTFARFVDGVYGHPLSWWAGIHQLVGLEGGYGTNIQIISQVRGSILSQILYTALNQPTETLSIIRFYVEHHIRNDTAGMLGRLVGASFTNYATRGGRRLGSMQKGTLMLANFVLASYGAAIIGIVKGAKQIGDIVGLILTGNYRMNQCAPNGDSAVVSGPVSDSDIFFLQYVEEVYHLNTNDNFRNMHFAYHDLVSR